MKKKIGTLIRNSAKCTACDVEIVSEHRHDFNPHYCEKEPTPLTAWSADGKTIVEVPGGTTFRFAVDGGLYYVRRVGAHDSYVDTSVYE